MRAIRLGLGALGLAAMGYGLVAALRSPDILPAHNGGFLLLVLVLHDGLLLPLFVAAGAVVHRFARPVARGVLQAALIASAAVLLIAAPLVLGYGRLGGNPSVLPRNYAHGLVLVLVVIWLAADAALLVRRWRARPGRPGRTGPPAGAGAGMAGTAGTARPAAGAGASAEVAAGQPGQADGDQHHRDEHRREPGLPGQAVAQRIAGE
jgi:hypothetical protein